VNDYEVLGDSEVFQIGEYKGVQLFVEKVATKPITGYIQNSRKISFVISSAETMIKVESLYKNLGGQTVLEDINLMLTQEIFSLCWV